MKLKEALMIVPNWLLFLGMPTARLLLDFRMPMWVFWPLYIITYPLNILLFLLMGIATGFSWLKQVLGLTMTDEEFRRRWMMEFRRNEHLAFERFREEQEFLEKHKNRVRATVVPREEYDKKP
jgi:hypothetical protein